MLKFRESSDDKMSSAAIYYLIIFVVTQLGLLFLTVNTEAFKESSIFLLISFLGVVTFILSRVLTKTNNVEFPKVTIWSTTTLFGEFPRKMTILFIAAFLIMGAYIFISVGKSPTFEVVTAPIFQVLQVNTPISVALSVFAAFSEDFLFFLVLPSFIFGIVYMFSKNFYLSLVIALFLSPAIFAGFHYSRAGTAQTISTAQGTVVREFSLAIVFLFGLIMTAWVVAMKNLLFPMIIHASNNEAVSFFYNNVIDITFLFYVFTAFVIVITASRLTKL